ncbi:MAG: hypothetical protein NPIRA01_01790 [Nitrospirales bacterium]|nr:MAG: hypothetical protein NPIRA01_01790 [Nitrospirales bacterium]
MSRGKIYIGTSGWSYDDWIGNFYPDDLKKDQVLPFYANLFDTVEVNNSFYHLPDKNTVKRWCALTPKNFIFSCKASRFITHMKKLKDPKEGLRHLFDSINFFGNKLGPILFQLPGNWRFDKQRLKMFLHTLPPEYRYTFEFRDPRWLCQAVYDLLAQHNCALCVYDYKGYRSPDTVTTDFVYLRLHGPHPTPYTGTYDGRTLSGYAKKIKRWADEGKTIYCYFDNDQKSCAPHDAQKLRNSLKVLR